MSRSTKKNFKSNSKSLIRSPQNLNSVLTPKTAKPSISSHNLPIKSHKPSCDFSTLSTNHTNEFLSHAISLSNSKNKLSGYTHTSKSPHGSQPRKNRLMQSNEASYKKVSTKLSYPAAPKRKSGQFVVNQSQQVCSEKVSGPSRSMPPQIEVAHKGQDKTPPKKKVEKTFENEGEDQEFVCIYSTLDINDLINQSKQDDVITQDTEGTTSSSLQSKQFMRPSQRSQGAPGHIHIESSMESTTQTSSEGIMTQESERSHMKKSVVEIQDSGNYSKKKTRHIQIDLEARGNERASDPKTSEFREDISDYLPTQEFKTENSRLITEESEPSRAIDEIKPEHTKNYNFQEKPFRRDEEINDFRYNVTETLDQISVWDEQLLQSKDRLQRNLNVVTQRVQMFTSRMISILQAQTESMIADISLEYEREIMKLDGFSEGLKGIDKWLQETDMDIKDNYNKILHNIGDEPYRLIMGKYVEKLSTFEQFFANMKDITKDPTHLLPTEKLSHFKRKLKITLNDAFSENIPDRDPFQAELAHKVQASSSPIPKIKTLEDIEEFLKSEEKLRVRPQFPNDVVISFKDKERFVNAVEFSVGENYTHGSQLDTLISNVILTESEELNPPILINNLDTPKLNSKLEGGFPESHNDSMSEGPYDSNLSVQVNSEESSLNKYMSLLDKVNEKQLNRNNYLKSGAIYDYGKRAASFYDDPNFISFLENQMKDGGVRGTCQKSLFQSPAFKDNVSDAFGDHRL